MHPAVLPEPFGNTYVYVYQSFYILGLGFGVTMSLPYRKQGPGTSETEIGGSGPHRSWYVAFPPF